MDSTEKQLIDMMKELQSRSEPKVILESGSFAITVYLSGSLNSLKLTNQSSCLEDERDH